MGRIEGFLEVGIDEKNQIVVNHPDLKPDENGVSHIIFSVQQARNFAHLLLKKAADAEAEAARQYWKNREAEVPPADRSKRTLTDGSPVTEDHREINPKTGMQKGYVVLSEEERAKGYVRPVRRTYVHATCGQPTTMSVPLAETYARCPSFYSHTFCAVCGKHFPVGAEGEFVWAGTDERVGT